jgi:hypothetical protein
MELAKDLRPDGYYRECVEGIDFPCWFLDNLKQIDNNLFLVWHEYETLTENIMNADEGLIEDPRFAIKQQYGQLQMGYVPRNRLGNPIKHQMWHIWWLRRPLGWCHVMPIDHLSDAYLRRLLERLHIQCKYTDSAKTRDYIRNLLELEAMEVQKAQMVQASKFADFQKENKHMLRRVQDNLERKIIAPSNPHKDVISSYSGQKHRSTLRVPITEKDAGIYTGD